MPKAASSTEPARRVAGLSYAALVAGALLVAAMPSGAQDAGLNAGRERWRAAAITSYEYGYRKYCECHPETPPETVVTVRDGAVVGVRHRPVGSSVEVPAEARNFEFYWTVDGLFTLLERAFERGAEVRVRYDDRLGFPAELFIDYDAGLIGDEVDLKLTQVTPGAR